MKVYLSYKRSTIVILLPALLLFGGISLINMRLDKYRIFNTDWNNPKVYDGKAGEGFNAWYARTSYLLQNKDKYDSLIFGSSKVYIGWDISGLPANWYRVANGNAAPDDYLYILKILLKNGMPIKRIILVVDHFSFDEKQQIYINRLHYPKKYSQWPEFLSKYLFMKIGWVDIEKCINPVRRNYDVKGLFPTLRSPARSYFNNNSWWFKSAGNQTKEDAANRKVHYSTCFKFSGQGRRYGQIIAIYREIIEICKNNNIRVDIVINPEYYKSFLLQDLNLATAYKRDLSELTTVWDYTGFNEYSMGAEYWVDDIHYIPLISRLMIDDLILSKKPVNALVINHSNNLQVLTGQVNFYIKKAADIKQKAPGLAIHPSYMGYIRTLRKSIIVKDGDKAITLDLGYNNRFNRVYNLGGLRYNDRGGAFSTWRYPFSIAGWIFPYKIVAEAVGLELNLISDKKGEIKVHCYRSAGGKEFETVYSGLLEKGDNLINKIIRGPCFFGLSLELKVPEGTQIQVTKFEIQRQEVADE